MYQTHFGLKKALFDSGIAQGPSVFLGPKQQQVVANAKVAITTLDSVLVVSGPAGVGKTTVAAAALRDSSTRLALGWLGGTPANASELLDLLLVEFGLDVPRAGRVERLQMWRQFLSETNATSSRVFVIVERADDLGVALLRALESFTAADPNGCAGANIVLLGEQALLEQLKLPALDSLRQRIRLRQKLEPFSADELRAYLQHQVTTAGGVIDKIFAVDAIAAIHRYTHGVPRLVNNLCETALTLAATRSEQPISAELVKQVATGLLGLEDPASVEHAVDNARHSGSTQAAAAAPAQTASAPAPAPATAAARAPKVTAPTAAPSQSPASVAAPAVSAPRPTLQTGAPGRAVAAPPTPLAPRAAVTAPAAPQPAAPTPPPRKPEFFESASTDIVADELLTATIVDETPSVAMADFPVLTDAVDAVEAPASHARPTKSVAATPAAKPAPPTPTKASGLAASTPAPRPAAQPARAPEPSPVGASKPATAARHAAPKPEGASSGADGQDEDKDTKTLRALAAAKSIDDISNSMAETLFGEADLDMFTSALAAGGWSESDDPTATGTATPAKKTDDPDAFDLFDLGPDAPLELIDDSSLPPQVGGRKLVTNR